MDVFSWIGSVFNGIIQMYGQHKNAQDAAVANAQLKQAFNKLVAAYQNGQIDVEGLKKATYEIVGADPVVASSLRGSQMDALRQLSDIGSSNGMDAQTAENDAVEGQKYAQATQQNRQAIADKYQRQGRWGSGGELAAQLQGGQDAANALRSSGVQSAAAARQRALQAISQSGQLSTNIRGQDESLASGNRDAENARQQFNARMREAASGRAVEAQKYNNGLAADTYNASVGYNNALRGQRADQLDSTNKIGDTVQKFGASGQTLYNQYSGGGRPANAMSDPSYDKTASDVATSNQYPSDPDEWNQYPGGR